MKRLALLALCSLSCTIPYARADDAANLAILRAGCAQDAQRLCSGVQPGGGRIIACLKQHKDELSDQCKQAAAKIAGNAGPSAPNAVSPGSASPGPLFPDAPQPGPSVPGTSSTSSGGTPPNASATSGAPAMAGRAPAAAAPSVGSAGAHAEAADGAPGSYLRMKKVQLSGIISDAPGAQAEPMAEMLIPTTWDFQGGLRIGGSQSGCHCDSFPIVWEAHSADGSTEFRAVPSYSWQYSDDAQEMRKLNDPYRRAHGANHKVCPVAKPLTAEQFFRQNVMPQMPGGATIISIEPYPELNQMARRQMGLAANDAGSNGVRTDAIRARVEFQKDSQPLEGWFTVAVVMRTLPVGRGSLFDLHAIDLMSMTAPKGKLAANDKLLRVMMTSIRLTPAFVAFSNKFIASYYQTQATHEAQVDQVAAKLQQDMTQIYSQMSANAARVSRQGFLEADQGIRGVQSFRDPATGQTMELSSQYDHAWLNGANEYVMSDDPNFNPNAQLSGSWSQLEAVRPSP